jgi:hypothetical protein
MGYWLGIGFGQSVMSGSDVVICSFKNSGNPTADKFFCSDRKATGHGLPPLDAVDNVDDIDTSVTFTTIGTDTFATLEATFDRLVDTQ